MADVFEVCITLQLLNSEALHDAARAQLELQGISQEDAALSIGSRSIPNIEACLVRLLDRGAVPGCAVMDSAAQQLPLPARGVNRRPTGR